MTRNPYDKCPKSGMTFGTFNSAVKVLFEMYRGRICSSAGVSHKSSSMLSRWQLADNLIVYCSGSGDMFVDEVSIIHNGLKLTRRNMSEDELITILRWILCL